MSAMQRTKGKVGEREIAALIREVSGLEVKRKVRNLAGESDLEGVPGWSIEVKRHAKITQGDVNAFWDQTCQQASKTGELPVLFYRADRGEWRAVWPLSLVLTGVKYLLWSEAGFTATTSVQAWWAVASEGHQ